jgi:ABC-2 type transport system ATP-binding protein
MPHIGVNMPSGSTLLALLPLALLMLGLVIYTLIQLARAPHAPYLPKWLWAALIVLVTPWGAIAYLLLARSAPVPSSTATAPSAAAVPGAATPPRSEVRVPGVPQRQGGPAEGTDAELLVSTRGLTRDYGAGAGLFDVDLRVPRNVVYGLVGPNGAGKSTLLSILTGVRHADRGVVHIGVPRAAVAVCPDVPEFEPWLTAFEVVDLARYYVAPHLGAEAVWQALQTTGLADAADRRVGGFSRGMTQRLGLAAALVGDPQLLLLDEPTSALDPSGRAEILELVAGMRGRRTVIFSSHILDDVQRVADHVGVLRAGTLLYQGDIRTLVDEHLAPSWSIRLSGPVDEVVTKLRGRAWVRRVEVLDGGEIRVDADTMRHGERGIPEVLASCRAGLIACEPRAADLETAFLALTGRQERS